MDDHVIPLCALRGRRRGYEITVIEEMINLLRLPAGPVRPPLPTLAPGDRADLERRVDRWEPAL